MAYSDDRIKKRIRLPLIITGVVMVLFYFGMGLYILFNPSFLYKIPKDYRTLFASLLLIYGAYRSWRLYMDHLRD